MRKIAKIILFKDDSFLFAVKMAPQDPVKHKKMELLGGGVEKGETPLEGLVRELTEEEQSSLLAHNAANLNLSPIEILIDADTHFIYHMPISGKDLEGIRISSQENEGYRLISGSAIRAAKKLDSEVFTTRTVKIFDKLRKLRSFPYDNL